MKQEQTVTQEKGKFKEQAVNKFIEMVLARLIDAERLQVRVKANVKELLRGYVDALTIQMSGFLLRRNLRVAEFQFDIGSAAVNLRSVMRRQIELLHPTEGSVRMVITQEQLTSALNPQLVYLSQEQQNEVQLQQVNCELRDNSSIAFHFSWISAEKDESGTSITIPQIKPDGSKVVFEQCNVEGKEPPTKFVNLVMSELSNILSLNDIANRGTTFYIQQVHIDAGRVTMQANAHIEQFPSG